MIDKSLICYTENVIPEDLANELYSFLRNSSWYWGNRSIQSDRNIPHWSIKFAGGKSGADSTEACIIENKLILQIWESIEHLYRGHTLVRCYANASTVGTDNRTHTDSPFLNAFTTILYVNPQWHVDWGGDTIVWDREIRQIVSSTLPKFRSMLTIPGQYWHGVRPISGYCDELRITLMFKTIKV